VLSVTLLIVIVVKLPMFVKFVVKVMTIKTKTANANQFVTTIV